MIFLYIFWRGKEFWKTDHHFIQKIGFTLNFAASVFQQFFGFISSGVFYGSFSAFARYYVESATDIFSASIQLKLKEYPIAGILENILLSVFMVLTIISVSMGKQVKEN